jgi:NAD(P)-dependent dehydrogenase (short-subunit alcohol dehydrogenase family)
MGKLEGKVAVITGGSSGMGFETAKVFVQEGAYVYITGRRQNELDAAAREIGHNITAVQGDVSQLADIHRLYKTIRQHHHQIDIVYANAGVCTVAPLSTITEEQFDYEFNINAKGTLFTIQQALPFLPDGSSIILNSSIATSQAWPGLSAYSGAKAAVRTFARGWSAELMDRKIRVNVISAGTIDTEIFNALGTTKDEIKQVIQLLISRIPMKRIGTPDEIAKAVLFLASDDSSFITGHELFVDGGAIALGSTQLR